jgi:hypothetical protein
MSLKDEVESKAQQAWNKVMHRDAHEPELADTSLDTFELCINEDRPGDGTVYPTIEEAKAAGYAAIELSRGSGEAFFTVHRIDAEGRGSALAFNSNQAGAKA